MKNVLLFIGIITIIILLLFRGEKIVTQTQVIQGKIDTVEIYKTKTVEKLKVVHRIHKSTDTIRIYLDSVITLKDTVRIIQVQSILIDTLTEENKQLYEVIEYQDSTIITLEEIDSLRVEENETLKQDNKKIKRKLFGVSAVAILVSIVAILK